MSDRALAELYQKFAAMLDTGMAPVRCLTVLAGQYTGSTHRALAAMQDSIDRGSTLTEAAATQPTIFRPMDLRLLEIGERSGSTITIMRRLAESLERARQVRTAFITRMIYPLLLLHAAIVIPAFVKWLVPGGGTEAAVRYLLTALLPLYATIWFFWFGIRALRRTDAFCVLMDTAVANLPLIGRLVANIAIARFVHTLELLYTAGVGMRESVSLAAESTGNAWAGKRLQLANAYLDGGDDVAVALAATGVFSAMMQGMIFTGVETGHLDEMLRKVGDHAQHDAVTSISRLAIIVPLVLYLAVVIGVAMMIFSMFYEVMIKPIQDLL
ncbi:MAG: type II secretion system F family protein [Lentisphaeria bacterium]|nr:type II secretion system F family protein [Lentisphaeria bacterium]MDP7742608.1 type II secretion system F family protein [Lentisphaeria bacterium]